MFSFCLYGPENPRYYPGMLENVYLAGTHFPSWKVYVYYAPDVTEDMVTRLSACSNVVMKPTGILGQANMIRRFFAIDEPGVDLMMVRDADSRIHWKDRWAINDFLSRPDLIAHTIRDHQEHTALIMGGLWGLRKSAGINVQQEYANYNEDLSLGHRLAHDQNFLWDVIYPKVVSKMLVHYSFWRDVKDKHYVKFPFEWSPDTFCGKVESEFYDLPQQPKNTLSFIRAASVRTKSPEPTPTQVSIPNVPSETRFIPSSEVNLQGLSFLRRK